MRPLVSIRNYLAQMIASQLPPKERRGSALFILVIHHNDKNWKAVRFTFTPNEFGTHLHENTVDFSVEA